MSYRTSNRNELIYRMHEEQKKSFGEIAELFGISRGRAWQIYAKKKREYDNNKITLQECKTEPESDGYLHWNELRLELEKLLVDREAFAHRIANAVARNFGYVGIEELTRHDNYAKLHNVKGLGDQGIAVLEHVIIKNMLKKEG